MDAGEVIPGLNEDWTLLGAKLNEWIAGMLVFMLCGDLILGWGSTMPLLLMIWVGTTLTLASFRRVLPDQERGLRNNIMVYFGFPPPGIPTPACIQPAWSGAPIHQLSENNLYDFLKLSEIFPGQDQWLYDKD